VVSRVDDGLVLLQGALAPMPKGNADVAAKVSGKRLKMAEKEGLCLRRFLDRT
jgi:hypothetical protein